MEVEGTNGNNGLFPIGLLIERLAAHGDNPRATSRGVTIGMRLTSHNVSRETKGTQSL